MGIIASIDSLKNNVYIQKAIKNAITQTVGAQTEYHETIEDVKQTSTNINQIAMNDFSGNYISTGDTSTFKLTQKSNLETIVETAFASNVLSYKNGVPITKLISCDLINVDNLEQPMPDYTSPEYLLSHILHLEYTHYNADFETQYLQYFAEETNVQILSTIFPLLKTYPTFIASINNTPISTFMTSKITLQKQIQSEYQTMFVKSEELKTSFEKINSEYKNILENAEYEDSSPYLALTKVYNSLREKNDKEYYNKNLSLTSKYVDEDATKKALFAQQLSELSKPLSFEDILKTISIFKTPQNQAALNLISLRMKYQRNADKSDAVRQLRTTQYTEFYNMQTTRYKTACENYLNFDFSLFDTSKQDISDVLKADKDETNYQSFYTLKPMLDKSQYNTFIWYIFLQNIYTTKINEFRYKLGYALIDFYYENKNINLNLSSNVALNQKIQTCISVCFDPKNLTDGYETIKACIFEIIKFYGEYDSVFDYFIEICLFIAQFDLYASALKNRLLNLESNINSFKDKYSDIYTAKKAVEEQWNYLYISSQTNAIQQVLTTLGNEIIASKQYISAINISKYINSLEDKYKTKISEIIGSSEQKKAEMLKQQEADLKKAWDDKIAQKKALEDEYAELNNLSSKAVVKEATAKFKRFWETKFKHKEVSEEEYNKLKNLSDDETAKLKELKDKNDKFNYPKSINIANNEVEIAKNNYNNFKTTLTKEQERLKDKIIDFNTKFEGNDIKVYLNMNTVVQWIDVLKIPNPDTSDAEKEINIKLEYPKYISFFEIYDTIAKGFSDKLEEKTKDIVEKVKRIETNIKISVFNSSFNSAIGILFRNNEDVHVNLKQENVNITKMFVGFDNVADETKMLPQKAKIDAKVLDKAKPEEKPSNRVEPEKPTEKKTDDKPKPEEKPTEKKTDDKPKPEDKPAEKKLDKKIIIIIVVICVILVLAGVGIILYFVLRKSAKKDDIKGGFDNENNASDTALSGGYNYNDIIYEVSDDEECCI